MPDLSIDALLKIYFICTQESKDQKDSALIAFKLRFNFGIAIIVKF